MDVSGLAAGLYPTALVAVNLGVGAALYREGAVVSALLLSLCGLFVLAGAVSALGTGTGTVIRHRPGWF